MTSSERRNLRRHELTQLKTGSLLASPESGHTNQTPKGAVKRGNSHMSLGNAYTSPADDDTTQIAGTAGYTSDDGVQVALAFGTQQTQEDEDVAEPLIKVKAVYPRGVFN